MKFGEPTTLNHPVIFLDNDGTLTNVDAHGVAYGRRYGELMAAQYGGTAEAWAKANAVAFEAMMAWYHANVGRFEDAGLFDPLYRVSFETAFREVGLTPPPWKPEGRLVNRRLLYECPLKACTLLPGAREAVEALARAGHRLCLASNAHSLHCEGVLSGCGLRGHFIYAFGPDLVDCPAKSVAFYRRICDRVGVRPEQAILVDDSEPPLTMAAEIGMVTVFVDHRQSGETPAIEPAARITGIGDLPSAVAGLSERCSR